MRIRVHRHPWCIPIHFFLQRSTNLRYLHQSFDIIVLLDSRAHGCGRGYGGSRYLSGDGYAVTYYIHTANELDSDKTQPGIECGRLLVFRSLFYSPTMAAPPNQAGRPSGFPFTATTSFSSSVASTTVDPSTVTTPVSSIASTQTDGQPQTSDKSSKVGLNTLQVTALAVGSAILFLALLASLAYLFFIRREKRRQSGTASRTLGPTEKYGEGSDHTFSYNQIPRYYGGTAPLLKSPTTRSRAFSGVSYISSQYDNESRRFPSHDDPSSQFINAEDEITQIPLYHAVPLADAIPKLEAQPRESLLDSASLLPYLAVSRSSSPNHLPNLVVAPDTSPPTRRSSRRKKTRGGSGYNSDDSDSMYSQASASTVQFHDAPSTSAIHELPPLPAAATDFPPSSSKQLPRLPVPTTLEEEHEQDQITDENNILVATLLMSRTKHALPPPSRNASFISHIERSGSIRPVLGSEYGEVRGARHLHKLHAREAKKPYKPRLSSTVMQEELEVET